MSLQPHNNDFRFVNVFLLDIPTLLQLSRWAVVVSRCSTPVATVTEPTWDLWWRTLRRCHGPRRRNFNICIPSCDLDEALCEIEGHDRQKWPRCTPKTWPDLKNWFWEHGKKAPLDRGWECEGHSPRLVAGIVDEGLNLQTHPRVQDKKVIFIVLFMYWYVIVWWCPTCWTVGHGFFGTSMS